MVGDALRGRYPSQERLAGKAEPHASVFSFVKCALSNSEERRVDPAGGTLEKPDDVGATLGCGGP
jgi:hypothetical protein